MNENQSSRFRFSIDDKSPDSILNEQTDDQRIDKLSQRVTIISILIPCLIAVMLYFVYYKIQRRSVSMRKTEVQEIVKLSDDIESRFLNFSKKQAEIEGSINKKIASLKEESSSLQDVLAKTQSLVKKIGVSKAEKKDIKNIVKKIDKSLYSVQNNLKGVSSKLDALENNFKDQLDNLAKVVENAKQELKKMQSDISALTSSKADKKIVDIAFKNERKYLEQILDQHAKKMDAKLASIKKRIDKLGGLKSSGVKANPKKTTAEKEHNTPRETSSYGDILEEDIQY